MPRMRAAAPRKHRPGRGLLGGGADPAVRAGRAAGLAVARGAAGARGRPGRFGAVRPGPGWWAGLVGRPSGPGWWGGLVGRVGGAAEWAGLVDGSPGRW